eukprot:scaffold213036_cov59-Attheya_sp.AAC.1
MTKLMLRSLLLLALSATQWMTSSAVDPDLSPEHQKLIVRRVFPAAGSACYSSIPVTDYIEVTEQGNFFVDFKVIQAFSDPTKCNSNGPPIFNHVDHMFLDVVGRCIFDSQVGCGDWQDVKAVPCKYGATPLIKLWVNDFFAPEGPDQFPTCSDPDGDSPDESCLPDRWCEIVFELVCNPSLMFLRDLPQ